MDHIKAAVNHTLDTVMGNVGVMSAMEDALSDPGNYHKAFRSAFVIAKSFFFLGDNLSDLEMIVKVTRKYGEDPEDRYGSKMAYYDREGRPTIIVCTPIGSITIDAHLAVVIRGKYSSIPDKYMDRLSDMIGLILLNGLPFFSLCMILDEHYNNEEELEKNLIKLHIALGWSAV